MVAPGKVVKFRVELPGVSTYKDPLRQSRSSVLLFQLLDIVNRAEGMRRRRCVLERGHARSSGASCDTRFSGCRKAK